jgi:hypothetical protein
LYFSYYFEWSGCSKPTVRPALLWCYCAPVPTAGQSAQPVFILPLAWLGVPVWLHVIVLAILTSVFSFSLRRLPRVEEKVQYSNALFAEKRRRQ